MRRLAGFSASIVLAIVTSFSLADANPYLAKAGERPLHVRIATCAVSGGFAHLYTALENRLFDPYGFKLEHGALAQCPIGIVQQRKHLTQVAGFLLAIDIEGKQKQRGYFRK